MEATLWVDCFIHKFAMLYSNIPSFLLFNNRYNVCFSYNIDGELLLDFSKCEYYFNLLLDQYGIQRTIIDSSDLSFQKQLILPCDSFFFPYSKQNYLKYHMEHFIILNEFYNGNYFVVDDNPIYNGWLSQEIIDKSYEYFRNQIYRYEPATRELTSSEALSFLKLTWSSPKLELSDFIDDVITGPICKDKALLIIEEARVYLKRYNAIENCAFGLMIYGYDTTSVMKAARQYTDELTFLSNLASIGLRTPDKYIIRIKSRLCKLRTLEYNLYEETEKMMGKI